jgi:hypothetical protein
VGVDKLWIGKLLSGGGVKGPGCRPETLGARGTGLEPLTASGVVGLRSCGLETLRAVIL